MSYFIDQMLEDTGLLQYSEATEQGISKAEAKVIVDYVRQEIATYIIAHTFSYYKHAEYFGGDIQENLEKLVLRLDNEVS